MTYEIGNVLDVLPTIAAGRFRCCVTSPPYWGLRDYGHADQLGLEATPEMYVERMVAVFREVRRTLTDDGTLWLNVGDSYATGGDRQVGRRDTDRETPGGRGGSFRGGPLTYTEQRDNLKPKDLVGIPWMLAFALRADGWYLRSDIIWAKPNPMPESVRDRPTSAHEHVFLLAKAPAYYYDAVGIAEPADGGWGTRDRTSAKHNGAAFANAGQRPHGGLRGGDATTRNARDVWTIAHQPYSGAHFAVFPPELARRCIIAGAPERVCAECGRPSERIVERTAMVTTAGPGRVAKVADQGDHARTACGGTVLAPATATTTGWSECGCNAGWRRGIVLDPFAGSGTTLQVARDHGRHAVGIELNADYARLAAERLAQQSLLGGAA